MEDEFHLQRFVDAQDAVYDDALAMLRDGLMCTPYLDFIFPRLRGGGDPDDGPGRFGITSLDEARAYLAFPLLGNRYRECVGALSWLADKSAVEVFGEFEARKLHASLTLFAEATNEQLLRIMLSIWFNDLVDEDTMMRLDIVP